MTARTSQEVATVVRVRIPSPLQSYTTHSEVGVAVPLLAGDGANAMDSLASAALPGLSNFPLISRIIP